MIPTLRQGNYYDELIKNIYELEEEIIDTFGSYEIITVENMLVNPAWNAGVGASSGHYVAVLNDDIIIYPKTFSQMKRQCDIHSVWCPYFTRADDKKVYQSNGENVV